MIHVEENPLDAKSFTDETSPRKRAPSDRNVSIHGQVIRDRPLNWFYDLMKLYPGESAEIKSTRILEEFRNLPRDFRERTWVGMKRVIINIVDSLSYQTRVKQIVNNVYKDNVIQRLLKRNSQQGDEFSKRILRHMDEIVTKWIIQDSPPERLKRDLRPRHWPGSLGFHINRDVHDDDELDLTPFKAKASSMTGRAVKFASKSGSVFNPARDEISPLMEFRNHSWADYMVRQRLRDSHAFDRGDDQSIKWIDSERKKLAGGGPFEYQYDDCDGSWQADDGSDACCYADEGFGRLHSISSESSSYTQAADIAAGFARQNYERYGIAVVAGKLRIRYDQWRTDHSS